MDHSLVMTAVGPDRPGLLSTLSETIYEHGGHWFESRLARFSGQFTGIMRFDCPDEKHDEMIAALQALEDLEIRVVKEIAAPARETKNLIFDVRGHHHPGIVRGIAAAITRVGGSLEEFSTERDAAPQPGHYLFRTVGRVEVMTDFEPSDLELALQSLGADITASVGSAEEVPAGAN